MKSIGTLLRYWFEKNPERITQDSLSDCHVKGLNSIMFNNLEGQRVRLFVTEPNHELTSIHAVAFHMHRYDIGIQVVMNQLTNVNAEFIYSGERGTHHQYEYKSCILDGSGSFKKYSDRKYIFNRKDRVLNYGDFITLKSTQYHTVICPENTRVAWLIYESQPSPFYSSVVYSALPQPHMENLDLSELYNPISQQKIEEILDFLFPDI